MARNHSNGTLEIYGIEKEIFMEFSRRLNFTPIFEPHGLFPGMLLENGTATGLWNTIFDALMFRSGTRKNIICNFFQVLFSYGLRKYNFTLEPRKLSKLSLNFLVIEFTNNLNNILQAYKKNF